jgi:signal transduction histidine kinase
MGVVSAFPLSQASEEVGPAQEWRTVLLQRLLVATTPIVAASVAMALWTSQGRNRVVMSLLLPVVPLQLAAIFAKKWSFHLRAWSLIGPLLFASYVTYGLVGFVGNASLIAASAIVFAALLFDRRHMTLVLALALAAPLLAAAGMLTGRLQPTENMDFALTMPRAWVRTTFVSLAVWAMVGLAVTFVVQRVEASLAGAKRALEELRNEQARRELAERERQTAQEAALQAQKMELVGRLAAGVAHDFNNVLGVVGSWAELLILDLPPSTNREEAQEAVETAMQQGRALTRRLLTLARRDKRSPTRIQLAQSVSSSVNTLRRVMPQGVTLSFETRAAANVDADETELQQVVFNLILNARDAIAEDGTIQVSANTVERTEAFEVVGATLAPGRWALLQVKDSGPGIAPELRERIFELFFTTKPVGSGTGLGLATVLRIAQLSGGGVAFEAPSEGGACFTVYLPCVE